MHTADNKFDTDVLSHLSERYKNFVRIGEGGTAIVYKAEDSNLLRDVAIKTMSISRMSPDMVLRFQHEARAASKLQHPNLITVLDFGLAGNSRPYLVMDFVRGKSLEDLLQESDCLPIDKTIAILLEVCRGMAFAHQNGVIHRDLKPSNILLLDVPEPDARVKVVDFGIAKLSGSDSGERPTASRTNLAAMPRVALERKKQGESKGRTGELMGSPFYMSPEQIRGDNVDQRTDIYSLGCIMFRMLSGMAPFEGDTHLETYSQHLNDLPPLIVDPVLPAELHALIDKCLAKNPSERPSSMTEIADALRQILKRKTEPAQRTNESERKPLPVKRSVAVVAIIFLIGAAVMFITNMKKAPEPKANEAVAAKKADADEKKYLGKWSVELSNDNNKFWQASPGATDEDIDLILPAKVPNISMRATAITNAGLEKLTQLPLTELDISGTRLDDSAIPILVKMKDLEFLKWESSKITIDGLRRLAPLKKLRNLDLDQATQITDDCVDIIIKQWPNIQHLNLSGTSITEKSILKLTKLDNLRGLEIAELKLSDTAMNAIIASKLKQLNLNHCSFDRKYVAEIPKMRKLQHLILSQVKTFKEADYEELRKSLRKRGCELLCVDNLKTRMKDVSPIIEMMGGGDAQ